MRVTLTLVALALCGCSDMSGRARPTDPNVYRHPRHRHVKAIDEDAPPPVTIEIEVVEDLGITPYVERVGEDELKEHGAGLSGVLRVTVTNTSNHGMVLEDLGIHNLVFEHLNSHQEYIIVHEGICSRLCRKDANVVRHLELDPGESRILRFAKWDYSDAWEMHPPAGRYKLGYRIRELHFGRGLMPGCSSPSMAAAERVAVCKKNLEDQGYWYDAFQAKRVKVRLTPTAPRLVR